MKGRESGMPDEDYWNSFFDADGLIDIFVSSRVEQGDVVEFGSGYGTFTIPVAKKISGIVHGFDIEADLIELVEERCKRLGMQNVQLQTRGFCRPWHGASGWERGACHDLQHPAYRVSRGATEGSFSDSETRRIGLSHPLEIRHTHPSWTIDGDQTKPGSV